MRESAAQGVMMVAGEPSGDRHAAEVARALRRMRPEVQLWGHGGALHERGRGGTPGGDLKGHCHGDLRGPGKDQAILSARRKLLERVGETPPRLAILVDFPDFNLRLAKSLKRKGIKVLYYIAPQAWAWRPKRVNMMAKVVDHLAVILPFEEEFFRKGGVKAQFVGHPLLEETDLKMEREEAKRVLGLSEPGSVLGLFPGSRIQEVRRMLPVMLDAANLVLNHDPEVKPVVALSPNADEPWVRSMVGERCPRAMVRSGMAQIVLAASDVASVASGTVSLEAALFEVPMIVVYRTSWFNYHVAKRW
jgi:Lipid A disaccharide synthetase